MKTMKPDTLWTVRGVARELDVCLVIEAPTAVAAECFAIKRAVAVVSVTPARPAEIAAARLAGRLWRYSPQPRLRCFGRPVGHLQTACFMACGLATLVLNLRAHHVPIRLFW
jgi:hypothetical protein